MSDAEFVVLPAGSLEDEHRCEFALDPLQHRAPVRFGAGEAKPAPRQSAPFWSYRISPLACALALLILDLILVSGSGLLVCLDRGSLAGNPSDCSLRDKILLLAIVPLAVGLSLWREQAYTVEEADLRPGAVAIGWLNASGLVALSVYVFGALTAPHVDNRDAALSPLSLIAFIVLGGVALLGRNVLWLAVRPWVLLHLARTPVVVAGAGASLPRFVEALERKSLTTRVVAVIPELDRGADEVLALVREGMVRTVFIVLSTADAGVADPLLAKLSAYPVAVRIVPDVTAIAARSGGISAVAGVPLLHMSDPPLAPAAALIKRTEDIVFSSLLLLAAAPIMLLASLAIKLESRGPVLFRQPRHGLNGAAIEVFKFRTMYAHLEDRLATCQTLRGDPRVTRVGAFMRRHSFDELPQLFNVLGGTLSLVGPRPHPLAITAGGQSLELVTSNYMARHRIKPGITGWAQVSGWRGNLDTVEKAVRRVEHDLYYIDHWSLLFDLRIILRTIGLVLHDKQAF